MSSATLIHFPPFRLDPGNEQLWRETAQVPLRPKPFAILRYLVERPGQLVPKEELLKAVWPETYVSDGLLNTYIRDLRAVLGDEAEAPRFIETVRRRGYRFIGTPMAARERPPQSGTVTSFPSEGHDLLTFPSANIVGRETEFAHLHQWLEKALQGKRQVVFVTGEPGIGKTTLVEAFLERVAAEESLWIGRGQCIEHYGTGEAYLPILEALGRLCRAPGGERLIALLSRYAPTWLAQMPALLTETDLDALQRKVAGATRERMLREFAEMVEAVTAERPVVLALEDLHWSDYSTLDLLTMLAQRREAARVLVLGTYRPAEIIVREHPLRGVTQELHAHRLCEELPLGFLSEATVAAYLASRFPGSTLPSQLARVLHQSTEGNPLFLLNVVEYLLAQGLVREVEGQWQLQGTPENLSVGIPDSLRQLIEKQIERLPQEEQRVLEVASVAGTDFSALTVAAGVEEDIEQVEAWCDGLVRREQFLRARGMETVPEGALTGRYGFLHTLYRGVLYERIGVSQRIRLHRRISECVEKVYGNRAGEVAAELAMHFEQGRDYHRAIQYLQRAAQNALQRSANIEAIHHLTKGLDLLKTLPETPERARHELSLQVALGVPLTATKGYAAPDVESTYSRAHELCRQIGESAPLFPALRGMWQFHFVRGQTTTAHELACQLLRLAERAQDPQLLMSADVSLGIALFTLGDLRAARTVLERGVALDRQQPQRARGLFINSPTVNSLSYLAWTLWYLGYPDQALQKAQEAAALAQELAQPLSIAFALYWAAMIHWYRGEIQTVQEQAGTLLTLANEHGFRHFMAQGAIIRGWALAEQEEMEAGMVLTRRGMAGYQASGAEVGWPHYLGWLAEAYGKTGKVEEGLTALAEGLEAVNKTEQRVYETELHRLKGELMLKAKTGSEKSGVRSPESGTEECFLKAIEIARQQQAKSLELRAVISLSRLWLRQRKKKKAQQMLTEIHDWFTEGFDTKDLREAKALLEELRSC